MKTPSHSDAVSCAIHTAIAPRMIPNVDNDIGQEYYEPDILRHVFRELAMLRSSF